MPSSAIDTALLGHVVDGKHTLKLLALLLLRFVCKSIATRCWKSAPRTVAELHAW